MRKQSRRERDRLKIDMQFQVHMADDDKLLCSGKCYAGDDAPGSSIPANRKIILRTRKFQRRLRCRPPQCGLPPMGMDSEEGQHMSRDLYHRLDQLGLSEGKSSLDPYERARRDWRC